jgi:signal transduction histidine kinase
MNQESPSPSKGNILVVDDTPANLRLLVSILRVKGYKVRPALNGSFALSAVQLLPPDLILLDIMMSEMDGYAVCEHLKADERTRDIPIIFISAINEAIDKVKAFTVGGVDYITKPFQIEEVLARVEMHLSMARLQKDMKSKNEELSRALQQLQATQNQLIQSEKMALLGQLIAGIGHEINTPLGAIRSSIDSIGEFIEQDLEELPRFFQKLSPERQDDFFALLKRSSQQSTMISSKEKRRLKRNLIHQLSDRGFDNADIIADTLVDLGIYDEVDSLLSLLNDPGSQDILNVAYQLASLRKSANTIGTATDRAAKIVFALKSYSRHNATAEQVETNIIDGIETVLTLYHNQLKQGVEVVREYEALPPILCYPDELNQVWTNLIHNALHAMNNQGTLTIHAVRQNANLIIKITDSGRGIPQEIQQKIFEPFFTTKPAGEGSGLGLDIVRKIINKHEGDISVESNPGQTTFTISLPIATKEETSHG